MSDARPDGYRGPGQDAGGPPSPAAVPAPQEDPTAALLREAMAAHTDALRPAERLGVIRAEAARRHRRTRLTALAGIAAAAVVATGTAIAVTGQDGPGDPAGGRDVGVGVAAPAQPSQGAPPPTTSAPGPSAGGSGGTAPPAPPAPAATSPAPPRASAPAAGAPAAGPAVAAGDTVPVYWLGTGADGAAGPALFREYLPASGAADAPTEALRLMLAGEALDPDYSTPWRPDPAARVEVGADLITVDVAAAALSNRDVGSRAAELAVQQLVHTVTAAAGENLPVRVLVDGRPGAEAWGAVSFAQPTARSAPQDVQAPVWITSLAHGAVVDAGRLTVEGIGTGFEATLNYTVHDAGGEVVAEGFTEAGANGEFGPFSFGVDVTPGEHTLSVFGPDMSDGEGPPPLPDTKRFSVR
ncbi:hypothetical protein NUM3379_20760 [Kineococcus sp. NUM-3379]